MGGGYEIDVMATHGLKGKHDRGKFGDALLLTLSQMAQGIVLTEYTAKVTIGKKNGPRAVSANKGTLLTKMGTIT